MHKLYKIGLTSTLLVGISFSPALAANVTIQECENKTNNTDYKLCYYNEGASLLLKYNEEGEIGYNQFINYKEDYYQDITKSSTTKDEALNLYNKVYNKEFIKPSGSYASNYDKNRYIDDIMEMTKESYDDGYIKYNEMNDLNEKYRKKIYDPTNVTLNDLRNFRTELRNELDTYKYDNSSNASNSQKYDTRHEIQDDINEAYNKNYIDSSKKNSMLDDYNKKIFNNNVTPLKLKQLEREVEDEIDNIKNKDNATNSEKNSYWSDIEDIIDDAYDDEYISLSKKNSLKNEYHEKIYDNSNVTLQKLKDYKKEVEDIIKDYKNNYSNNATTSQKDDYWSDIKNLIEDAYYRNDCISFSKMNNLKDEYEDKIYDYSNVTLEKLKQYKRDVENEFKSCDNNNNYATTSEKNSYRNDIKNLIKNAYNDGYISSNKKDSLEDEYNDKIFDYSNVTLSKLKQYKSDVEDIIKSYKDSYNNSNGYATENEKISYYNQINNTIAKVYNAGNISYSSYINAISDYYDKIFNSGSIKLSKLKEYLQEVQDRYNNYTTYNDYNYNYNRDYYYNLIKDLYYDTYNRGYISLDSRDNIVSNYHTIIYYSPNVDLAQVYAKAKAYYDSYYQNYNNYNYYYNVIHNNYSNRFAGYSPNEYTLLITKVGSMRNNYNSNQNEYQILKAFEDVLNEMKAKYYYY